MSKKLFFVVFVTLFATLSHVQIEAAEPSAAIQPEVSHSIKNDLSPPLRLIEPVESEQTGNDGVIPMYSMPKTQIESVEELGCEDSAVQDWHGTEYMPAPIQNFEGVSNVNYVLPPDTNGDVGPNHSVQWVNKSFAIWDKSGNLLYGPVNGNTLWSGFGGICESTNNGDPIVQYDHLANRWMMSQFALGSSFHQCSAVSQTGAPSGAWYGYDVLIRQTKLNEYPKGGVGPEG